MRQVINGMEYEIPTGADGSVNSDDIRRIAGIAHIIGVDVRVGRGEDHLVDVIAEVGVDPAFLHVVVRRHDRDRGRREVDVHLEDRPLDRASRLLAELRYEVVDEQGPDHRKTFTVEVMLSGEALGAGSGESKKAAEQQAAREALTKLKSN